MLTATCPRYFCLVLLLALPACGDEKTGSSVVDGDGDGVPEGEDVDDADPEVWLPPDEAAGDMRSGFTTFCAGYAERSLEGDLVLSAATEDDLAALGCLTAVGGDVWVWGNDALADFSGLEALTTVGGDVTLWYSDGLTDLAGLEALASVGGDVTIGQNDGLVSLSGLEVLTTVGGEVKIWYSYGLTSLSGLEALVSVGDLSIELNSALTSLAGLNGLVSIGRNFEVENNNDLVDISGLESLHSVGRDLRFLFNSSLCADDVYTLVEQLEDFSGDVFEKFNDGSCP